MSLRFYNTLTQQVEEFSPARDNTVRMYTCGPTVYDFAHIGNFRSFTFVDLLRKVLRLNGFKLDHVMNITDVDDKIIRNAARDGVTVQEYTKKYKQAFLEAAKEGTKANRARVDEDDAKGVADLRAKGMTVIDNVDKAKFVAALAPVNAQFEKEFGKANLDKIRDYK